VRLAEAFNRMADDLHARLATINAEQRELRAVLGGMVEGVLAVDRDERVVLMNEAGGRILGLDPAEIAGKPLWEVVRLSEVTETLASAVREGAPRVSEIRRHGGPRDRVLRLHASPLVDPTTGPSGAVLVLHDITELRQLEQVRRDFVANASHELKTPLAAIRGLVETILDDEAMEPATKRRFLGSIQNQAARLGSLVEEMLALSRLEAEGVAVPRHVVDLREPVREALQSLLPLAHERHLAVVDETAGPGVGVSAGTEPLRRIAGNLIDNAFKYTPARGTVRVRVRVEDDRALLEVEDDGPGIAPAERERIFERFYRLDKGRGREQGGTGLGLAIVKHLVAALDGQVFVLDAPGGGSLFRVAFPLADRP
jgi:two-component system phosphate regulon sensor histidine kinase PhoR